MSAPDGKVRLRVEGIGRRSAGAFDFYTQPLSVWNVFRRNALSLPKPVVGGSGGDDDDDDDDDDDAADDAESYELAGGEGPPARASRWSLEGVSFEVSAGEAVAIVGGPGTGAEVLLRIVSGLYPPDAGKAWIYGRSSHATFHNQALLRPDMTVQTQTRALAMLNYVRRRDRRRWRDDIFDAAIVDDAGKVVPSDIFDAARRLSVAASIDPTADLLIVDDFPTAFDGEKFRRRCEERFEQALARGAAAIVSLTDTRTMIGLCTRAIRFEDGRIVEEGSPSRLVAHERQRAERVSRDDASLRGFNADVAIIAVRDASRDGDRAAIVAELEVATADVELEPKLVLRGRDAELTFVGGAPPQRCALPGRYVLECEFAPPEAVSELDADLLLDVDAHGVRETIGRRSVAVVAGAGEVLEMDQAEPLEEDAYDGTLDAAWRLERV